MKPTKNDCMEYLEECFNDVLESLMVVKKWSRSDQFLPYINTLEDWDQVVGEKWFIPENSFIDPTI